MVEQIELFPWNETFETGIARIDEQHRQLVHLINRLAIHVAVDAGSDLLEGAYQQLADYVVYHFRDEEAFMHEYLDDEPESLEHRRAHHGFEAKVAQLKRELDEADAGTRDRQEILEAMLRYLTHWFAFHILDTDKRMTKTIGGMRSGMSREEARRQSEVEMSGAARVLIQTILVMYDSMSSRTLQLMREIHKRQQAEQRLQLAGKALENTVEAIFITDAEGLILEANPSFCRMVGCAADAVLGKDIRTLHPGLAAGAKAWRAIARDAHWTGEVRRPLGPDEFAVEWLNFSGISDEHGVLTNCVGVFSNVSDLLAQRSSLQHLATHDVLTGLPNRALLKDRLDQEIKCNARLGGVLAVLFVDLDGFKQINDAYGHDAGDCLLIEAAARFNRCVRASDTVARLGGDEFVILLPALKRLEDCEFTVRRLIDVMAEPVICDGQLLCVTVSVGVAGCPDHSADAEELLLLSDKAMYLAKQGGKNRFCLTD